MNNLLFTLKKFKWFEWLHHSYVILATIGMVANVFFTGHSPKEIILLIAFALYFLVLLIFVVFFTITNGAKAKYAEAIACIHESLHAARNIYHRFEWAINKDVLYENAEFKNDLVRVLTSAAQAFSITTGVKCRICIKVIGIKDNSSDTSLSSYYVTTLARDSVSQEQARDRDAKEGQKHLIADNTDFNLILKRERNYFFHPDLQKLEHYENSSFKLFPETRKYASTIVWPIRYVYCENEKDKDCGRGMNEDQDIYGFLAVDSYSRNAFSERYDVQMGSILADGLFPIFDMYRKYKSVTAAKISSSPNPGGVNNGQRAASGSKKRR